MLTVQFEKVGIKDGDRVLDLGCGEGRHIHEAFAQGCEVGEVHAVGVDLGFEDLRKTQQGFWHAYGKPPAEDQRWSAVNGNALLLPFDDGTFDVVICSEVLEHIPDWLGVLDEINRVLKPGGTFVASVPRFWPEWIMWAMSTAYSQDVGGHIRIFKGQQLPNAVKRRGFQQFHTHGAHALHSPYWWLRTLFWETQETNFAVNAWKKLLEWDILKGPWLTRKAEQVLNPFMGKSVAYYFRKDVTDKRLAAPVEESGDLEQAA